MKPFHFGTIFTFVMLLLLMSCAAVQEVLKASKPNVDVDNLRFVNMSFQDVDLAFDLKVTNPNPFSARLAGLDYDFQINNASFLQGQKNEPLVIEANGQSNIEIPLKLTFADLYTTYQSLKNLDSTDYKILSTIYFDLPVLGKTPINVSKSGQLPLVKLPKISISSLKLKSFNFSGANLELKLGIDNPNAFKLFLNNLNYDFSVNGAAWASGVTANNATINDKGQSILSIPISLDFVKMGGTVYNLLKGESNLNYDFSSQLDLNTSVPILKNIQLPLDKSGQIKLTR